MNCDFYRDGEFLICHRCGRPVKIAVDVVLRMCEQVEPTYPCILFEDWKRRKAWKLYQFTQAEIDTIPVPFEILQSDSTLVGTNFKKMALVFDRTAQTCDCNELRLLLDTCSLEFIEKHFSTFVDLISSSANKKTKWFNIPRRLISLALRRALRLEANKWKSANAISPAAVPGTESSQARPNSNNAKKA